MLVCELERMAYNGSSALLIRIEYDSHNTCAAGVLLKNLFFCTSTNILIATALSVPTTTVLAQGTAPSPAAPAKTKVKVKAKPIKKMPMQGDAVESIEAPVENEVKPAVAPDASGFLYPYPYHDSFIVGDNTLRYFLYTAQEGR